MIQYIAEYSEEYLEHHGIKGQKWGIRRYQNEDGTLTKAGQARYGNYEGDVTEKIKQDIAKDRKNNAKNAAITIGSIAAVTIAAYGGVKLSQFLKDNKVKPFSTEELKAIGIDVFEPATIAIDRFEPNKINFEEAIKKSSDAISKSKSTFDELEELTKSFLR